MAREGPGKEEVGNLRFRDVNAEGFVTIQSTKEDESRSWFLGEDVARAIARWKELRKAGPDDWIFAGYAGARIETERLAERIRAALKKAGVERPELYESTATQGRFRGHDLRGTFVTLALASGRGESWVADRTGHGSSIMINRYRKAARSAAEAKLGWLDPLDTAIPELRVPRNDGTGRNAERGMRPPRDDPGPRATLTPVKVCTDVCTDHAAPWRNRYTQRI